jgi:hypothetical protein
MHAGKIAATYSLDLRPPLMKATGLLSGRCKDVVIE